MTGKGALTVRFLIGAIGRSGTPTRLPGGPFQGHLDTTRIGLFGHSAGGAAATLACHHDPSCPAALDIDGYLFGDVLNDGLGKPFGFLGNQNSLTEDPYQHSMLREIVRRNPCRRPAFAERTP